MTIEERVEEAIKQRYSDAGRKGGLVMSMKKRAHIKRLHALNEARRAKKPKARA